MARKAIFRAGKPVNLPAAALDALEWLIAFKQFMRENYREAKYHEARVRLERAITALTDQLKPHVPERYEREDEQG